MKTIKIIGFVEAYLQYMSEPVTTYGILLCYPLTIYGAGNTINPKVILFIEFGNRNIIKLEIMHTGLNTFKIHKNSSTMKARMLILSVLSLFIVGCDKNSEELFTPIPFTLSIIAQGELSGSGMEDIVKQNMQIKTNQEWTDLSTKIDLLDNKTDNLSETEVDFTKYLLIAIFDEVRLNGGWSIDITDITEYDDSVVINIENLKTGNLTSVITQPYCIAKVSVSEKRIIFKDNTCDSPVNTLKSEWNWYQTYTAKHGIIDNDYESVVKIFEQEGTTLLKYEVWVEDLLYSKGILKFEQTQWYEVVEIKLPHRNIGSNRNTWIFSYPYGEKTICFGVHVDDANSYYYKKVK